MFKAKVTANFKMSVNVCLDNIFCMAEPMSWVMLKDWFAVFKVKVTVKAHFELKLTFYCIYWIADLFSTKFN